MVLKEMFFRDSEIERVRKYIIILDFKIICFLYSKGIYNDVFWVLGRR